MKQALLFLSLCAAIFGCKSRSGTDASSTDTTAKFNYPFTPKYSIK